MGSQSVRLSRVVVILAVFMLALTSAQPVPAQDVVRPDEVDTLRGARNGDDVDLSWDPVLIDASGNTESVDHYKVYRGNAPDFVPDKTGGSNLIGSPTSEFFSDTDAILDADSWYYLISAVDGDGNESNTDDSLITTLPVLSGFWTDTSIEVSWTAAAPGGDVVAYRVYYGKGTGDYEFVDDVGLATSHSLTGLQLSVNWYVAVTAVDVNGNETPFSNEHIDAVRGVVRLRVHDGDELCWGASDCTPTDPEKVQRSNGWQLMIPVDFPEGDWVSVQVQYVIESRLCTPPAMGTVTKCGSGNPCVSPPCNGGYNPCGDPWDRTAHLFLVLDDCIEGGGSCITQNNLELIRAVTPFGTDASPPDGSGQVRPRRLFLDVTPFAPLMTGRKYVGAHIGHFVQKGWWVTVEFTFSERPGDASPKPPADGIEIIGFGGAPLPTKQVSIPATASEVKMRLFTTGHGGSLHCNGGSNDANPCTINGSNAECPGGVCSPCDEFCQRNNRIIVNSIPAWEDVPWRTDCNAAPGCQTWNACGFPSCTFSRSGWCPGYIACHDNPPCDNDLDFTTELPAGGTYDIDYDVVPQNGSWSISLVLYWYN